MSYGLKEFCLKAWKQNITKVAEQRFSRVNTVAQSFVSKTSQGYMDELKNFIVSVDVNALKIGTEYMWPYLRQRIWVQLYAAGHRKENKMHMEPGAMQLGRKKDLNYDKRLILKKEYNALEIEEIVDQEDGIDFLFITVIKSSEQVFLENGKIYHRILDPLFEVASKVGRTKKIEMLRVSSPALKRAHDYYHPVQHILPPHIYKSGYHQQMNLPKGFLKNVKKKIPSLVYSTKTLEEFIDWEMHTRDYYIDLFQRLKPRYIFINGFHYQAPLISAADHLKIITIDVQHGIQVGWNPLYNFWPEIPESGYQAIVDKFFVWGEKEARSIKSVFGGKKHSPQVIGFPWLDRQYELSDPLKEEHLQRFSKYRVKVLLVLQNQTKVPKLYVDLIKHSPDDILWIVRHHPKGRRFSKKDFVEADKGNVFLSEYWDEVVLMRLFDYVDVVVSEGSTVAAEADYAGVYNFVFGRKGRDNYKEEVKAGHFFHFGTHKKFFGVLASLDLNKKVSRAKLYDRVDVEAVFNSLLR